MPSYLSHQRRYTKIAFTSLPPSIFQSLAPYLNTVLSFILIIITGLASGRHTNTTCEVFVPIRANLISHNFSWVRPLPSPRQVQDQFSLFRMVRTNFGSKSRASSLWSYCCCCWVWDYTRIKKLKMRNNNNRVSNNNDSKSSSSRHTTPLAKRRDLKSKKGKEEEERQPEEEFMV